MKTLKLTEAEVRILLSALSQSNLDAPRLQRRLQALLAIPKWSSVVDAERKQQLSRDAGDLFDRGRAILEAEIEARR